VLKLYAFQLCIEKMYCSDDEELSDKEEELLKKFTPGDSGTWFYYYDTAQETVQSAIVDQCRKVGLADFQYKKLKEENETCEELSVARAAAREEYKKLQEQKPKRGRPPTKK
jgi:hypothetical protein